jgi:hypothetical protein
VNAALGNGDTKVVRRPRVQHELGTALQILRWKKLIPEVPFLGDRDHVASSRGVYVRISSLSLQAVMGTVLESNNRK